MLVRLLLVVLTVVGSIPVHLCTCDAAVAAPPTVATPPPSTDPVSACGHRHQADEPEPGAPDQPGAWAGGHVCDCPVATPHPATPPVPTDAATDAVHATPALLDALAPVRLAPPASAADPLPIALPLYLSLLTLRI